MENTETAQINKKEAVQTNERSKAEAAQKRANRKVFLDGLRDEAKKALDLFISNATEQEVRSMISFAAAKNASIAELRSLGFRTSDRQRQRMIDDRVSKYRAVTLSSQAAADIMASLPIVDALLVDMSKSLTKMYMGSDAIGDHLLENIKESDSIKMRLKEVSDLLTPIIDKACDKGLVRNREALAEYQERKRIKKEMTLHGIDPEDPEAHNKLEEKRKELEAQRAAQEKEAREQKERLKAEEEENRKMNDALMDLFGLDKASKEGRAELRKIKIEMKEAGVDPKNQKAVTAFKKKREDTNTQEEPAAS